MPLNSKKPQKVNSRHRKSVSSLNEKLSKEFTYLKQSITALNSEKNAHLAAKIKTEYFSDIRYGKTMNVMDTCIIEPEDIVGDIKRMREKFRLRRLSKETKTLDECEGEKESALIPDKQSLKGTIPGTHSSQLKRKTKKKRNRVTMDKNTKLRERDLNKK